MKKLIILLSLVSFSAFAEKGPTPSTMRGIHIVPLAMQEIPDSLKQEILTKKSEENLNGYQVSNDENARYLLTINRVAPQEIKEAKEKNNDVYDTHLKNSFEEIKLAFPFNGINEVQAKNVIGYAAIGSYVENKGWTGVKEIFNSPFMGNCAYSRMAIEGVQLAEETTEYFVNKKPSNKVIEGNQNSGFLYTINWYTNKRMSTLECANKKFDKEIISKMIVLANKIDAQYK